MACRIAAQIEPYIGGYLLACVREALVEKGSCVVDM